MLSKPSKLDNFSGYKTIICCNDNSEFRKYKIEIKIGKQSEAVYRGKTENIMIKRLKNEKKKNSPQNYKDKSARTPHKSGVNPAVPEG